MSDGYVQTPIENLEDFIKQALPDAKTALFEPFDQQNGAWFMDVVYQQNILTVEWSNVTGFGFTPLKNDSYSERPSYTVDNLEEAKNYIAALG